MSSLSRRKFRRNKDGIESMPLQLLIIMAILALTIPIIMNYWMTADSGQVENNTLNQLNYLGTTAKQLFDNGVGNRDIIKLDFKDGTFTKIEYINIGGDVNKIESSLIKWKIKGEQERTYIIPGGARIGNHNEFSDTFNTYHIGSGTYNAYLECKESTSGILYIEIGTTS